jgi:hypothetical protein
MLTNDGNCKDIVVPSALVGNVMVRPFTDQSNGKEYCILMDHKDSNANGKYDDGFLFFVTPNYRADIHRRLHFHAPHVQVETICSGQALKILKESGAHSVLIPGAHRGAYNNASTCHVTKLATEATEDDRLAFHIAFKQTYLTSNREGWNPTYIQWHGMTTAACAVNYGYATTTNVFISLGTINSTFYQNGSIAIALRDSVRAWTTNVPLTETPATHPCDQIAVNNIQGRVLNGVPLGSECAVSTSSGVSGKFISIEQHTNWRSHTGWYDTIRSVFPTDCASGKHYENVTKMCV